METATTPIAARAGADLPAGFLFASLIAAPPGAAAVEVWRELLACLPQAHFLAIAPERATAAGNAIIPWQSDRVLYRLASDGRAARTLIARTDLYLDPFPNAEAKGVCLAIAAGVLPVASHTSPAAARLLHHLRLPDLVADSDTEYRTIAIALATHPELYGVYRNHLNRNVRNCLERGDLPELRAVFVRGGCDLA